MVDENATATTRQRHIVVGSTYAPPIVDEDAPNRPTNLIGINAAESYGSPSYWLQRAFSNNTGKDVVGATLGDHRRAARA